MKDPKQFRERFKKWKEGTPIEEIYDNGRPTEYVEYMKRLAQPMAKNWGISEKEAYVHLLNDDSYDYYGWWKDGGKNIDPKTMEAAKPPLLPNDDGHFPDTYKTAKHPTFSNQSKYSGVVHPKYNPLGIHGGAWLGDTYLKGPMYLPGYSVGKDDRTYIGGSNLELVVTPGKSWTNPYTGEYTRATESYAQPIASKDPYVDYQFYSPTGNSIVQTINSTPRWQQYWADHEGAKVSNTMHEASPKVFDLLMSADAAARLPELALEIPEIYKAVKYGAQQGLRRISPSYDLYKTIGETAPKVEVGKPTIRTKLGDVEIDNPGLAYRQGNDIGRTYVKYKNIDNSAAQFQIENNLDQIIAKRKNTPYVSKESILDDAIKNGKWTPEGGIEGNHFFYQDTPMYADGYLWYGAPKINETLDVGALNSGLLVSPKNNNFIVGSSKATPYRRTGTGILHSDGVTYVTDNLGRLIPSDVENLGLNLNEIEAFTWKPGYGYKRVVSDVPAMEWAEATRTPKITAENAANITPEQWTAAQDAAVARGDIDEAQRLRDLHFMINAPTTIALVNKKPLTLYHGTKNKFNVFDLNKFGSTDGGTFGIGIYTTPSKSYAELYGDNVMSLYMKLNNPIDYRGYTIADLFGEKLAYGNYYATRNGVDGVIGRPSWKGIKGMEEYVSHKPKNVKLADAITYDDNGIRIPLGLRDNFKLNDIRYSLIPLGFGLGAATLPNKYARGKDSGIYIKPSKRGTFTAAAKKRGMSVLSFASKVLNNPSNYSKAMRKKALFAKNASKFKH